VEPRSAPRPHPPKGPPVHQPTWDPHQYLRHADHRTRPFLDLLHRVPDLPHDPAHIADLGCGPGNVTRLLTDRWPTAHVNGLDTSPAMLTAAAPLAGPTPGGGTLTFHPADATDWTPDRPYDLLISNAALQWVPNHPHHLPRWLDALTPGGTLALQVPGNGHAPSHALLDELCDTPRWRDRLAGHGRHHTHVLDPADYLDLLTTPHVHVDAWETTYVQLLTGDDPVLSWTRGTALRPVLTTLADDPTAAEEFTTQYRDLLRAAYPTGPHGTLFPFRRVFVVATRTDTP
jgi:trans-aconitate 2-methyltransferase